MAAATPQVGTLPSYLQLVRADNPGPMTLEGTNTWVVGHPGEAPPVVVDPGPAVAEHLRAVVEAACGSAVAIVLTHRHPDHSASAAELAGRLGCPVLAVDPALRTGAGELAEGTTVQAAGAAVTAHLTPGHTSDSCSLLVQGEDGAVRLLTGDTVLGRGTSVIAAPDGDLGAYLDSLARLQTLVREHEVLELLPGHGPRVPDPQERLAEYRRHRQLRLQQVQDALAAGDRTAREIVERVYAAVDQSVWPAAEQSVQAQLNYLSTAGTGWHRETATP